MADFPSLPLWTDALLADTGHLTDCEFGLYLRVLVAMWRSPGCRLPADDAWLERKFSGSDTAALLREFCHTDGNWWTQKRLLREREYVRAASSRQTARAKSRWRKDKDLCRGTAPIPTPTPLEVREDPPLSTPPQGGGNSSKEGARQGRKQAKGEDSGFAAFWALYPRKVGKGQARRAYTAARKKAAPGEIAAALDRYKASLNGAEPQFTRHAATWLNGEGWLDEPGPQSPHEQPLDPEAVAKTKAAWLKRIERGEDVPEAVRRALGLLQS